VKQTTTISTVPVAREGTEGITTGAIGSTTTGLDSFLDYEVKVVLSIEKQVAPPDPGLEEEDDFVDVLGVITIEQAAAIIENIETALELAAEEVEFDETLIPTGSVTEISEAERATLSTDEVEAIEAQNEYAGDLSQTAAQRRLERKASGFDDDKPPTPASPPTASPDATLEIDFGKVLNLFGDTDVSGRRLLPRSDSSSGSFRRRLQAADKSFDIDVRQFMSFELVRGDGAATERKLRFTPKLGDFTGSKMKIKFDF